MQSHSIIVCDADMDRLSRLVRALRYSFSRDQQQLELLDQTLESAEVTSSDRIPANVVRITLVQISCSARFPTLKTLGLAGL